MTVPPSPTPATPPRSQILGFVGVEGTPQFEQGVCHASPELQLASGDQSHAVITMKRWSAAPADTAKPMAMLLLMLPFALIRVVLRPLGLMKSPWSEVKNTVPGAPLPTTMFW